MKRKKDINNIFKLRRGGGGRERCKRGKWGCDRPIARVRFTSYSQSIAINTWDNLIMDY